MADREKVIKGLETCIPMKYETNEEKECRHEQCPYGRENYKPMNGCFWDLMADALELLKEQPERKCGHWEKSEYADDSWHKCSECGTITERVDKNGYKLICNYCRICGADMRKDGKQK